MNSITDFLSIFFVIMVILSVILLAGVWVSKLLKKIWELLDRF